MTIFITKACSVKLGGAVLKLQDGDFITLPDEKAGKIIAAGHARTTNSDDYRAVVSGFGTNDPRGNCWSWVQKSLPETWKRHIQSLKGGNLAEALATFNEMVTAWNSADKATA